MCETDLRLRLAKLLFDELLKIISHLDIIQGCRSLFLVYLHEAYDEHNNLMDPQSDAKRARQFIQWFSKLRLNIYSDRTAGGNNLFVGNTPSDTVCISNILLSQLRLLPGMTASIDRVILCGSERLGHYLASTYYRETYSPGLKAAYQQDQSSSHPCEMSTLRAYVNKQSRLRIPDFHHVLTEIALLDIRVNSQSHCHGIVPVVLNGEASKSLPDFIEPTTVRIEGPRWSPDPIELQRSFFSVLKQLFGGKDRMIQSSKR